MSGQHTQGRLVVHKSALCFAEGNRLIDMRRCPAPEADTSRLAACWNAFEGVPTEEVAGFIGDLHERERATDARHARELAEADKRYEAKHDALAEALRQLGAARALLHELTDIQAPDAGTGAWAELAARVQSYLKGATA